MGHFANGTQGVDYEEAYCSRCIHWKGDGTSFESGECAILWVHSQYNYKVSTQGLLNILIPRDKRGNNLQCRMFIEAKESL